MSRGGGFSVTTNLLHLTDTKEKGERKGEEEEKEEARGERHHASHFISQ